MLQLGLFETIVKVQRAFNGIAVLEYAIEQSGPYGSLGSLNVLTTMLGGSFLSAPMRIFEGAQGVDLEGPFLQVPTGNVPIEFDPISSGMRSKLLLWSAPSLTDIVPEDNSTRFGTGRALLFFNVGKILSKVRAQEFSFTINTLDPFEVPGNTTIYYLYDPSVSETGNTGGTLDWGLTHPYTTGDPFSPYPPSDPLSVMTIPCGYGEAFEADRRAAVMHQFHNPTQFLQVQVVSFGFTTFNPTRWYARLSTYKKEKKNFPLGLGGPLPVLLDEVFTPQPGWDVDTDVNRVGKVLDTEDLPHTAKTLTFTIKKDLTCKVVRT